VPLTPVARRRIVVLDKKYPVGYLEVANWIQMPGWPPRNTAASGVVRRQKHY
jgi:hypothetical protein